MGRARYGRILRRPQHPRVAAEPGPALYTRVLTKYILSLQDRRSFLMRTARLAFCAAAAIGVGAYLTAQTNTSIKIGSRDIGGVVSSTKGPKPACG